MAVETKRNHICVTEIAKTDKEQAKRNWKERREQIEYDCR